MNDGNIDKYGKHMIERAPDDNVMDPEVEEEWWSRNSKESDTTNNTIENIVDCSDTTNNTSENIVGCSDTTNNTSENIVGCEDSAVEESDTPNNTSENIVGESDTTNDTSENIVGCEDSVVEEEDLEKTVRQVQERWKEYKKMMNEEEELEKKKWKEYKLMMAVKAVEESMKKEKARENERIEKEEMLACINEENQGILRPSLFANVPPFLRFVATNSLPGKDRVRGRVLSGGMERMGWYNTKIKDQDRSGPGWTVKDCIEYNGFKMSEVTFWSKNIPHA